MEQQVREAVDNKDFGLVGELSLKIEEEKKNQGGAQVEALEKQLAEAMEKKEYAFVSQVWFQQTITTHDVWTRCEIMIAEKMFSTIFMWWNQCFYFVFQLGQQIEDLKKGGSASSDTTTSNEITETFAMKEMKHLSAGELTMAEQEAAFLKALRHEHIIA